MIKKSFLILFFILGFYSCKAQEELTKNWSKTLSNHKLLEKNQCFCALSFDQKTTYRTCKKDTQWPLASVTKLFLSYWAADTWGLNYQFKTRFSLDQSKKHLHISGGEDPYFLEEGIFYLISTLNKKNIQKLQSVSFDSKFVYHFTKDKQKIINKLTQYLNTSKWDDKIKSQYQEMLKEYQGVLELPSSLQFSIGQISSKENTPEKKSIELIYKSSPLIQYLRILNAYSNNFSSDHFFELLGGEKAFNQYISKALGFPKNSFSFHTGSGLPVTTGGSRKDNLATCDQILKILSNWKTKLNASQLDFPNLMTTPVEDVGTLSQRFQNQSQTFTFELWEKT